MSSICRGGFVENAWRKDLCSNCFRTREEHVEEMTSGFYQQPWAHQGPSVAIHVKSPSPPSTSSGSIYGLPPAPIQAQGKGLISSRYQSPSLGSGINQIGTRSTNHNNTATSRYAYGNVVSTNPNTSRNSGPIHSVSSSSSSSTSSSSSGRNIIGNGSTVISHSGINVTVNGTSNSNIKKYIQQHPPQAAVRTSLPNNPIRVQGNSSGGVSVSLGQNSNYNNQLNLMSTSNRIPNGSSYVSNNSSCNYINQNSSSNHGTTHHYQRRTTHLHQQPQPPTHNSQNNEITHPKTNTNNNFSSVPVLTQSRNTLVQNSNNITNPNQSGSNSNSNNGQFLTQMNKTGQGQGQGQEQRGRIMDTTDGEVIQVRGQGIIGHITNGHGTMSNLMASIKSTAKGILKRDGQKRKMSVTFPQEVCAVIGYGGTQDDSSDDESEDEVPTDPLDSSSVSEILEKSASSPLEKELNRVTVKNTNFNSIKTNLMGYAPIEIGPIVGGTGGKSKPLVSIGTFDTRKEPLRVIRRGNDESTSKNVKIPISKMVTNKIIFKGSSNIRESEKLKTNNNPIPNANNNNNNNVNGIECNRTTTRIPTSTHQNQPIIITNDNRNPVQRGRGNESIPQGPPQVNIIQDEKIQDLRPIGKVEPIISQEATATTAAVSAILQNVSVSIPSVNIGFLNDTNIGTKRNSFLREIISSEQKLISEFSSVSENFETHSSSLNSVSHDSLEPPPPRIINTELKLEVVSTSSNNHFHQKQQENYEDDSLEGIDSGVETKIIGQTRTSETSESDTEKSGSNSDSGNENDFLVDKVTSNRSLFVSIDQETDSHDCEKKPAKLSPDSVISSEMSSTSPTDSSGSSESIPEKIEEEVAQVQGHDVVVSIPTKLNSNPSIPIMLKRAAPLPPVVFTRIESTTLDTYSTEDLYDDVHLSHAQNNEPVDDEDDIEESLYDDCSGVAAQEASRVAVTKGSYDFLESGGLVDPEFGESIPLKQHEGIEFLGIRRIDSESFLKQVGLASPYNSEPITSKNSNNGKKERAGSESPKQKRRVVNHFFSTIGKRAGAAFSRSGNNQNQVLDLSPTKTSSMKSPNQSFSPYKRSMSTDEVSMTRTQELYATLTPTSLKFRGLTPVLNKLSKIELREPKDESGEKKKNKFSNSIKKFLGFGPRGSGTVEDQVDFQKMESPERHHTQSRQEQKRLSASPPRQELSAYVPSNCPLIRPPPPPPRVHSLDISNPTTNSGTLNSKPARPPPPRTNQIAPSFVSVFGGLESEESIEESNLSSHPQYHPPNKPKRKASLSRSGDSGDSGAYTANYLETTYNHITSLNFETLKLIASQEPAIIKRASNGLLKMNKSPLRWSQFYVTDVDPLAFGKGFAFFSAFWEDEPCILLLQESLSCGLAPLEFHCIDTCASFEDLVQPQFIPWEFSDYVNTGNGVRVYISVLAACTIQTFPEYLNSIAISPSRKYYALLQAMDFWGKEEITDLVVFHKVPTPSETIEEPFTPNKSKSSPSPNFGLVYVISTRIKSGSNTLLSYHPSRIVFENQIRQLLLSPTTPLLVENDMDILLRRLAGSTTEEVEAQLRLFLQLKLFGPQSGDLDKILRYRSEKQVTQWMDKERAYCMNDALKRSLERNSEPISPLRKSFVEFLMISDNCAKTVLDFIVDLYPADS